jgi:hypothetical protein
MMERGIFGGGSIRGVMDLGAPRGGPTGLAGVEGFEGTVLLTTDLAAPPAALIAGAAIRPAGEGLAGTAPERSVPFPFGAAPLTGGVTFDTGSGASGTVGVGSGVAGAVTFETGWGLGAAGAVGSEATGGTGAFPEAPATAPVASGSSAEALEE